MVKSCYRALAITAALVLLVLFWDQPLVWPLKVFVVLLHELSHATAALLTGGGVSEIVLSVSEPGLSRTRGGSEIVILNAGYVGSILIGLLLLVASKNEKASPKTATALAIIVLIAAGLLIRPVTDFAFHFAVGSGVVLLLLALLASPLVVGWILRVLGASSVLYALWDLRVDMLGGSSIPSDAAKLADKYGYPSWMLGGEWIDPTWIWGSGWILLGVLLLFVFRRLLV